MTHEERHAQAQGIYCAGLELVKTTPPPKGQKYPPGTRVRIADDLGSSMAHFESGKNATVRYTYAHAYGGDDVDSYCLDIDGHGEVSWYHEHQLTPIAANAGLGDMLAGAVVVLDRGRYHLPQPVKIDRVTGTQIVIGTERFRRDNGYKIGESGGWARTRISAPEPGEIEKCRANLKRARLAAALRETRWDALPLATLESVTAAVEEGMSPNDGELTYPKYGN